MGANALFSVRAGFLARTLVLSSWLLLTPMLCAPKSCSFKLFTRPKTSWLRFLRLSCCTRLRRIFLPWCLTPVTSPRPITLLSTPCFSCASPLPFSPGTRTIFLVVPASGPPSVIVLHPPLSHIGPVSTGFILLYRHHAWLVSNPTSSFLWALCRYVALGSPPCGNSGLGVHPNGLAYLLVYHLASWASPALFLPWCVCGGRSGGSEKSSGRNDQGRTTRRDVGLIRFSV